MSLCEQALRMKVVGRFQTHLLTLLSTLWKSGWIPFNWRFLPQ